MRWTEKVRSIIAGLRKQGRSEIEVETIVRQAAEKATVKTVQQPKKEETEELWIFERTRWQQANNWRKMHRLPMRRKGKRR